MASQAAAAAEAAAQQIPRRFGTKQIFLPKHVIAFVRPQPRQPPNLASFMVPLSFNKLDLRDYLYHAYNVEVASVRSFIKQPRADRRGQNNDGPWYRPRAKKMMIAELVKPFVWPDPIPKTDKAREEFDYAMWNRIEKHQERQESKFPGERTMWSRRPLVQERIVLKTLAEEFLKSGEWKGQEGNKWIEVEEDYDVTETREGREAEKD